jgi:alpha-L-fucosidase
MAKKIPDRMKWWTDARFGMFIHWGLYAIPARGEWVMFKERIPKAEYAKLADRFKPGKFDADEWVKLAREAGMRYMVLTTRHHDGFSLFDSQVSDFTSVKTAAKRDFVGEYVEACRRADMPVGFYYSLLDWRWPAYWKGPEKDPEGFKEMREYVYAQVKELMTQYGKIDILWYDGSWPHPPEAWASARLNRMARRLQPGIIINNRSGLPADFGTPEQRIAAEERPWETCMTINAGSWGYHKGDTNLKSPQQLVHNLVRCVAGGGNYLLNVGPKADGTIPASQASRLRIVGKWLKANGESIYGAGQSLFSRCHNGLATAKDGSLYLHVMYWSGKELVVVGIGNRVTDARLLESSKALPFSQKRDRLFIRGLPQRPPDPLDTVVKLEIDGRARALEGSFWR